MSRVMLIAADKPLPLCDFQEERTKIVIIPETIQVPELRGKKLRCTASGGFKIEAHEYYRYAVDALGHAIKPFQYELSIEAHESDLLYLKEYLMEHFSAGDEVELWNLWVGIDQDDRPHYYAGKLSDFDMETLKQFLEPRLKDEKIGQCKMTITI